MAKPSKVSKDNSKTIDKVNVDDFKIKIDNTVVLLMEIKNKYEVNNNLKLEIVNAVEELQNMSRNIGQIGCNPKSFMLKFLKTLEMVHNIWRKVFNR